MQPEDFFKEFDVADDVANKLTIYHKLLLKWQRAINLVGPKTVQNAWARHFKDSAQILKYIPEGSYTLVDLGSGAGFPAAVLGIMNPNLSVHAIESDERKAQFIKTVSRETSVDIKVHDERIESVQLDSVPDIVTARALADLKTLMEMCRVWLAANPALKLLLLKGAKADEEILEAQKFFNFEIVSYPSLTDGSASVLLITNIKEI